MRLDEIQSTVVAQIAANAALVAFGQPFTFSYEDDEETVKDTIAARLTSVGVCIEVGEVSGGDGEATQGRGASLSASFEVFVAENPKIVHAPKGLVLVKTVIGAVIAQATKYEPAPICTGYDPAKSENGYILHVLTFTVSARIA